MQPPTRDGYYSLRSYDEPKRIPTVCTLTSLDSYLRKECPDEFKDLPSIDLFTFSTTPDHLTCGDTTDNDHLPLCNTQLRIGQSTGDFTAGKPVYLCIGGDGNNNVRLTCDDRIYKFNFDNFSYVHMDDSLRKLCCSGDRMLQSEVEKKRLKAYACYLFLQAGHIQTVIGYQGFKDDLRLACTWLAKKYDGPVRTARQKAAMERKKADAAEKRARIAKQAARRSARSRSTLEQSHDLDMSPRDPQDTAQSDAGVSRRRRIVESDSGDETTTTDLQRSKLESNVTEIRHHYELMGENLRAFESAHASMNHGAESTKQLKHTITQQAREIDILKKKVRQKDDEIAWKKLRISVLRKQTEQLEHESRNRQAAVFSSQQDAEKEKAVREIETALRKKAEDRLREYLEAHKKIAEIYNGFNV